MHFALFFTQICHRNIYHCLQKWSENCGILQQSEYGFSSDFMTVHAVSHLKEAMKMNVTKFGKFYACFSDYQKAYNFIIGIR